jgi:hypothetical protein
VVDPNCKNNFLNVAATNQNPNEALTEYNDQRLIEVQCLPMPLLADKGVDNIKTMTDFIQEYEKLIFS